MGELSESLRNSVFYGILDTGYVTRPHLFEKCAQLLRAKVGIIQLRAKKESHEEMRNIAMSLLPLFEKHSDTYFIINDDVELAAEICKKISNSGMHAGQDDGSPKDIRKAIGTRRVLGRSTHSIEQALEADSMSEFLDYFAVGPVFATNTKPGRKPVGLELVEKVSQTRPKLPWFAIGGVNMKTACEIRKAGADRIVAVSDVLLADDTAKAVEELTRKFLAGR